VGGTPVRPRVEPDENDGVDAAVSPLQGDASEQSLSVGEPRLELGGGPTGDLGRGSTSWISVGCAIRSGRDRRGCFA
jgi:hypothetical protein